MISNFLISILTHVALIVILFITNGTGSGNFDSTHKGSKLNGIDENNKIIPKPSKYTDITRAGDGQGKKSKKNKKDVKCERYYGGIGIQRSYAGDFITEVYSGYPADRVGMKVGDQILNHTEVIRGEVGTTVRIILKTKSGILTYNLVREKICIE